MVSSGAVIRVVRPRSRITRSGDCGDKILCEAPTSDACGLPETLVMRLFIHSTNSLRSLNEPYIHTMSFAGKELALRCCRNAFQQASRDTRRLRLMRQISTQPSSSAQYSPRPITSLRPSLCVPQAKALLSSTRPFSTSNRQAAKAIVNPRKDEDGKEMIIEITPRASHVIKPAQL